MSNLRKILEDNEQIISKAIDTGDLSDAPGTANKLYVRDSLTEVIEDVSRRATPVVDMLLPRAKRGMGAAHVFNKKLRKDTAPINPRDAVYDGSALPTAISPGYDQVRNPFVAVGYSNFVTGLAEAQGRDILDLEQESTSTAMGSALEALEWLVYWGSTTTLNTASLPQFAGLDELITQEVDAGGERLTGVTGKSIIDEAAQKIALNGGRATHLLTSMQSKISLDNTYFNSTANGARIEITQDRTNLVAGEIVGRINTAAGTIALVGDTFLNPGNTFILPNGSSSTPSGATTSTAFMVNMDKINMVNLEDMVIERLGRRTDKKEMFVKIYTTLEVLATEFMVKITNIDDTRPTA